MRITISGSPGSVTTSLAKYISSQGGYDMVSAGELFRMIAKERGLDLVQLGKMAENDLSIDALIDVRQKEAAQQHAHIVLEGRLSGWMVENADLKIWLTAPLSCRAKRVSHRDGIDEYAARMLVTAREGSETKRYQMYYKFDLHDLSIYHIVLDSERWTTEQLGELINKAISFLKK